MLKHDIIFFSVFFTVTLVVCLTHIVLGNGLLQLISDSTVQSYMYKPDTNGKETRHMETYNTEKLPSLSPEKHKTEDNNSSEIRHIGFLKVRKAGGSTMQNIFFRFGLDRNLTFVLPKTTNYFKVAASMPVKPGGHYDILATHSWFRKEEYDKILPHDKVNIAIVREPMERFISAAHYYRDVFGFPYLKAVPVSHYIQELILHPEKYEKGRFSETRNSMGQDFGFEPTLKITDTDKISKKLKFLESEFKLVLITDRFEESLVLMKRFLHWKLKDILYISRNTHSHAPVNITEELRAKYRNTSFMDFAINEHFLKIFDKKVEKEGPEFQNEVEVLQNAFEKTSLYCNQKNITGNYIEFTATKWNNAFKLSETDCKILRKGENPFIAELKVRHKNMNSG